MRLFRLGISSLAVAAAALSSAAITGVINQGNILIAGPGVGYTPDFFSDTLLIVHGWDEVQGYTLTAGLDVDITTNGTFGSPGSLTPGTLGAGTVISSHNLYFDPVGSGGAQATFGFDGAVIGVIVVDDFGGIDHFLNSDYLIPGSVPGANIPGAHFAARGPELNGSDQITVAANHVTVSLTAGSPGDQIRVITASSVPEPSSLIALALPMLLIRRRRARIGS